MSRSVHEFGMKRKTHDKLASLSLLGVELDLALHAFNKDLDDSKSKPV
jgi:hypothetical protein